jgi:hypothetical protein
MSQMRRVKRPAAPVFGSAKADDGLGKAGIGAGQIGCGTKKSKFLLFLP